MEIGLKSNKEPNPRENANPLSVATFSYTFPTFCKTFKQEFDVKDIYETYSEHKSNNLSKRLEEAWRKEIQRATKMKQKPSLRRALILTFGLEFIIYGIAHFIAEFCLRLTQPLILGHLINYYAPNQQSITKTEAYICAVGVICCSLIVILINHPYIMGVLHVGMKIRVACCALIYRKALKLSQTSLRKTNIGQIVNLLSNDVNRFDVAVVFAHQIWIGPLECIIVTYLMYQEVGVSAVFGVTVLLLFIPIQFLLANKIATLRFKTAIRTDERISLMEEIICGMRVIKMYAWEKQFANLIAAIRRLELKIIKAVSYLRGIILSLAVFTSRISLFITILVYVLFNNSITAKQVFLATAFYNLLQQSMITAFSYAITQISEANVSIQRVNKFLLYDEITEPSEINGNCDCNSEDAIIIDNGFAKWNRLLNDNTLINLNLNIKHGSLVAIVGPVGSGKSSLLHAILKELPLTEGRLLINGKISYAAQEPWLFSGTVRQNILFNNELDKLRYKKVVNNCALLHDFTYLPYADYTSTGDRGILLSGGQRARINLARAIYKIADIYLLDDLFSAVDVSIGKQIFNNCILNYLKGKTVILVTHQLQYLKQADHIIVLENGSIKKEGSFIELKAKGIDFVRLLNHDVVNSEEKYTKSLNTMRNVSIGSIISLDEIVGDMPEIQEESTTHGSVSMCVYKSYLFAGTKWYFGFAVLLLFVLTQIAVSSGDYFVAYWVNLQQNLTNQTQLSNKIEENCVKMTTSTCVLIYMAITVLLVLLTLSRSISFINICMRASKRLHNDLFDNLVNATMRFFGTNNSGSILNRFSKDMGLIDEYLPSTMIECMQIGLAILGIIIVVAVVNPWLMFPILILGLVLHFLRTFYLRTSRNIKRLEAKTRSPLFTHLSASLQGLTTIRAFEAEDILEIEFDGHQDLHSSTWYLFIATSRAFGYWLDLICVFYTTVVTLSFLFNENETNGGNIGLAITQTLNLTGMLQRGMRQSAEIENQMISVERVLEYNSIEHERSFKNSTCQKPQRMWPNKGKITFVNLYLRYSPKDFPVLKNLNFTIEPLEKIGIVGRTGAGKTSLMSALLQLYEIKGSIIIDDVDINSIDLYELRSKIAVIPQEPVLFAGTVRRNLDPFDDFSDEVLWKALEDVELREFIDDLGAGLHSNVFEGGANFSIGQRQLICLARASIRKNKILILDEATANVDPQTDALIQHTLRKKFKECTVLTIAHRLHTIMDSDKILVMDAGTMIEFDHPHILLKNTNGTFYRLIQESGKGFADVLTRIAENNYNSRKMKNL